MKIKTEFDLVDGAVVRIFHPDIAHSSSPDFVARESSIRFQGSVTLIVTKGHVSERRLRKAVVTLRTSERITQLVVGSGNQQKITVYSSVICNLGDASRLLTEIAYQYNRVLKAEIERDQKEANAKTQKARKADARSNKEPRPRPRPMIRP